MCECAMERRMLHITFYGVQGTMYSDLPWY